jgi:hypothetical protein
LIRLLSSRGVKIEEELKHKVLREERGYEVHNEEVSYDTSAQLPRSSVKYAASPTTRYRPPENITINIDVSVQIHATSSLKIH